MRFAKWLRLDETGYYTLEPEEKIASGTEADVYTTIDPDVVVRVQRRRKSKSRCEKILARPDIQRTGGVVLIYGSKNVEGKEYTYKQRVSLNWDGFLSSNYPGSTANEIIDRLLSFKDLTLPEDEEKFNYTKRFLRDFPETANLVAAIEAGVPIVDLYGHNFGVNNEGKIVIIDC